MHDVRPAGRVDPARRSPPASRAGRGRRRPGTARSRRGTPSARRCGPDRGRRSPSGAAPAPAGRRRRTRPGSGRCRRSWRRPRRCISKSVNDWLSTESRHGRSHGPRRMAGNHDAELAGGVGAGGHDDVILGCGAMTADVFEPLADSGRGRIRRPGGSGRGRRAAPGPGAAARWARTRPPRRCSGVRTPRPRWRAVRRRWRRYARGEGDPVVAGAVRMTGELMGLAPQVDTAPVQVWTRLHQLAAADLGPGDQLGHLRTSREPVPDDIPGLPPAPPADEMWERLSGLAKALTRPTKAPGLVVAAIVHAELAVLRPFPIANGLVARAAERAVLVARGIDPVAVTVPEVGHSSWSARTRRADRLRRREGWSGSGTGCCAVAKSSPWRAERSPLSTLIASPVKSRPGHANGALRGERRRWHVILVTRRAPCLPPQDSSLGRAARLGWAGRRVGT